MLNEMWGAYGSNLSVAVVGVAAGFLCLILVLWLIRGRGGPSPFLRGGKNRQPRLQVLDAAAVDARRRLVLVRRDDVEHLIMIGGPTDIVIESSIVDGRSPPYHTMMKTVSETERTAIAGDEQPRVSELPARPAGISTAPAPAAAQTAKTEKPAPTDDTFAWIGSEPVDLPPATKPAEPVRPTPAPQPVARKPETPRTVETSPSPAQSTPVSPVTTPADITSPGESRSTEPKPAIDFPVVEPRMTAAAVSNSAPIVPAFSASAAAVASAPVMAAPVAMKAEPAPMIRIDDTPSEPLAETSRTAPSDVAGNSEPRAERGPSPVEHQAPSLDNAVDLLDAVRERVFQQSRPDTTAQQAPAMPAPVVAAVQRPVPSVAHMPVPPVPAQQPAAGSAPAKPLGSDFERILEEEMASNLAGGNAAPSVGPATSHAPASQLPRRDPNLARVTGATQEPAMQNEIARIFGEMSVTKDDR